MKNKQWSEFNLPGSLSWHEQNALLFGNERNRVLGPREQAIYEHYCEFCYFGPGCKFATPEKWRMESQRIPNV